MRLDRYLAECGLGTRSEVKKYIRKGQVKVNDMMVKDAAFTVDENENLICCNGRILTYQKFRYYMLNKPAGCVSATRDNLSETVLDLLKGENIKDLFPVGRLDKDTEGLLLLTNDGELAHELLAPGKHVDKTYYVISDKALSEEEMKSMEEGLDIGDEKKTLPAQVEMFRQPSDEKQEGQENGYPYLLTIREGRFHQVKRMFEACAAKVVYLKRLRMGSLELDRKLAPGEYRPLTAEEIAKLKG